MMRILYEPPDNILTSLPCMDSLYDRYRQGCFGAEQGIDTQFPAMLGGGPANEDAAISEDIGSLDILPAPSKLRKPLAQVTRNQVDHCWRFFTNTEQFCQQGIGLEDTAIERLTNRFQHAQLSKHIAMGVAISRGELRELAHLLLFAVQQQ